MTNAAPASADLNGDSKADLVAVRTADGNLARWWGNGSGGFSFGGDYGGGWGSYNNLVLSPSGSGGGTPPPPPPPPPPTPDPNHNLAFHLTSQANGRLVTAELGHQGTDRNMLRARSTVDGAWQKFRLISTGSGTYAIWSEAASAYVSAEVDNGGADQGMLRARASAIGDWEKFRANQRQRDNSLDKPIYFVHGFDRSGTLPGFSCEGYWGTAKNDYRNGASPRATGPLHTPPSSLIKPGERRWSPH